MIHPDTELRFVNEHIGHGLFATRRIPMGTITWVLDPMDIVIAPERYEGFQGEFRATLDKYTYTDGQGNHVLCWDLAKFMNHSCDANCYSPGTSFEIAVRDIEAGEEVTCDYATLNLDSELHCRCGTSACRGTVHPEDFVRMAPHWDERLKIPFGRILEVTQPLMYLVSETSVIKQSRDSLSKIPSVLNHYLQRRELSLVGAVAHGNGNSNGARRRKGRE